MEIFNLFSTLLSFDSANIKPIKLISPESLSKYKSDKTVELYLSSHQLMQFIDIELKNATFPHDTPLPDLLNSESQVFNNENMTFIDFYFDEKQPKLDCSDLISDRFSSHKAILMLFLLNRKLKSQTYKYDLSDPLLLLYNATTQISKHITDTVSFHKIDVENMYQHDCDELNFQYMDDILSLIILDRGETNRKHLTAFNNIKTIMYQVINKYDPRKKEVSQAHTKTNSTESNLSFNFDGKCKNPSKHQFSLVDSKLANNNSLQTMELEPDSSNEKTCDLTETDKNIINFDAIRKMNFDISIYKSDLDKSISFLYFIKNIANLAGKLYRYDLNSKPEDLFNKCRNIVEVIAFSNSKNHKAAHFKAFDLNTVRKDTKRMGNVEENHKKLDALLDYEYLNFMKIYRNQYRLIYIQFLYLQATVDTEIALNNFLIAKAALNTIHWLVTFICNFVKIEQGCFYDLKIYNLNLKYIENMDLNCKFTEQKTFYEKYIKANGETGIYEARLNESSAFYICSQFINSLIVLLQLPIEYWKGNEKIGIDKWNKQYNNLKRRYRNEKRTI